VSHRQVKYDIEYIFQPSGPEHHGPTTTPLIGPLVITSAASDALNLVTQSAMLLTETEIILIGMLPVITMLGIIGNVIQIVIAYQSDNP